MYEIIEFLFLVVKDLLLAFFYLLKVIKMRVKTSYLKQWVGALRVLAYAFWSKQALKSVLAPHMSHQPRSRRLSAQSSRQRSRTPTPTPTSLSMGWLIHAASLNTWMVAQATLWSNWLENNQIRISFYVNVIVYLIELTCNVGCRWIWSLIKIFYGKCKVEISILKLTFISFYLYDW